ncbi:MAG: AAA family ATPase [Chloroflexota bacterium]
MLKRIYIDNYKCLVNFDLSLNQINLFLGPNGSGKSTLFEVLGKLQSFISGESKVNSLFKYSDRCRWQTILVQRFEIEYEHPEGLYKYELAIEHGEEGRIAKVKYERLFFNNKPLLEFENGNVQLYRIDHTSAPVYNFDWTQSAVASIFERPETKQLMWFKEQISGMVITQVIPRMLDDTSDQENAVPASHFENFVSWYRFISQDQGMTFRLQKVLQNVLPQFDSFKFELYGEQRRLLKVVFKDSINKSTITYSFAELSDGQRMLIVLYSLLQAAQEKGYMICIDEPENFLALPEIQPWLVRLYDQCMEDKFQAILISHHPEMINYLLASPVGYWFDRQENLSTRVMPIQTENDGGVPISELIARGWLHD